MYIALLVIHVYMYTYVSMADAKFVAVPSFCHALFLGFVTCWATPRRTSLERLHLTFNIMKIWKLPWSVAGKVRTKNTSTVTMLVYIVGIRIVMIPYHICTVDFDDPVPNRMIHVHVKCA